MYYTRQMAAADEIKFERRYADLVEVCATFVGKQYDEVGMTFQKTLALFMQKCDAPGPETGYHRTHSYPQCQLSPWIAFVKKDPVTGLCLWSYRSRY